MAIVYIGLGSNLGDRHRNCLRAIELIEGSGLVVSKQSAMYETAPWGVTDQPAFVNMAIEIETDLDPQGLMALLKRIEKAMGRQKTVRWGPRIIDLDILFYNQITLHSDGLIIPHPLMHEREFVLKPLSEIAKDLIHPVLKRKISDLSEAIKSTRED
jgi:2-amino-4-hydroxy-6-hydroxymethyldihydropteridine diphosphokinase